MRVMKGSQVNQFYDKNYTNPCYGNKDDNKEYIMDESNNDNYLLRIATVEELSTGQKVESIVKYQFYSRDDFSDAEFEHEEGRHYAWKEKVVTILHDPKLDKPVTKLDKRAKDWKEKIQIQDKIAISR
jgi:hypothetical protein